jgi:hypothetical protein
MNNTQAKAIRARPPTSISHAQSVATSKVAMTLKGHHPHPNPPSAMNGTLAMLPNIARRMAVRLKAPSARASGRARL